MFAACLSQIVSPTVSQDSTSKWLVLFLVSPSLENHVTRWRCGCWKRVLETTRRFADAKCNRQSPLAHHVLRAHLPRICRVAMPTGPLYGKTIKYIKMLQHQTNKHVLKVTCLTFHSFTRFQNLPCSTHFPVLRSHPFSPLSKHKKRIKFEKVIINKKNAN